MLAPCIVGVFVIGGTLLSAFGTAYEHHAIGLLRIVLIAAIPDAVTNVYVAVLRVQGRLVAAAGLNVAMGLGVVGSCPGSSSPRSASARSGGRSSRCSCAAASSSYSTY